MYPPQRAGVRATTIHDLVPLHYPGVGRPAARARCTARKYRERRAHVRRRSSPTRRSPPTTSPRRSASRASAIVVAHPGIGAEFTRRRRRRPTSAARTCSPSRRSSRARTSARSSRRSRCSPTRASRSPSSAARAGASSRSSTGRASSGSGASPTTSSRGSTAAPRPSSTRRASRASGCRSPRRWRRGAPVVASSHPSLDEACGRRGGPRRPREPEAIAGGDPRGARAARRAARAGARARRRVLLGADRRALPRGVPAIRVALDTTPLRQTRAGTARYVRGLLAHLDVPRSRGVVPGDVAARARVAADALWYPRLRAPRAPTCSTARPSAGRSASTTPLVVTVHDLAVLRHPEWFNRWTRTYSRLAVPRVVRAATRVIAVSEFTKRELVELLARARGEDPRRAERGRGRLHARRARGPRATTCSRSGRSSRARTSRASRPRSTASCASSARAAGAASSRRANVTWLGEVDDEELARALPRRALPRLRVALRGLRHPGRRGARLRLPGRDEPRQRRWPSSPATTRPRRPDRRRLDPRRASRAPSAPAPRRGRVVGRGRARDARRSTRSSRDPDRRRRARPRSAPATRRTSRTCCASCPASRPTCASPRSRGIPSSCPTGVEPIALPARLQELRMAWSLPRLLRRLRPAARALPARAAARLARPRGRDRPRPLVRARPERRWGALDRLDLPDGRAARGAPGRPRARRLGAHEARRRRALRRRRRRRSTVTPNGVDPRVHARRRRRTTATCSSSARSRRARTRSPRSRRPRAVGLPLVVAGPEKEPELARELRARRRRPARLRPEGRARRALPRRGGARAAVALRGLRAAGARGDGERHAGRRRRRAGAARGRRATRPSTPTTATSARRVAARARRPRRARRPPGSSARSCFSWAETARRTAAVYRQVLAREGRGGRRLARARRASSSSRCRRSSRRSTSSS